MNDKQALTEAKKRWGKYAAVRRDQPSTKFPNRLTHTVGFIALGLLFDVKGQGTTWEEAFANADSKAQSEAAKRAQKMIAEHYGGMQL